MQFYKPLFFIAALCFVNQALAGVQFIMDTENAAPADGGSYSSSRSSTFDSRTSCLKEGYTITSCQDGLVLSGLCPYQDGYYSDCCEEGYVYTKQECYEMKRTPSQDTCAGLYFCE